MNLIPIKDISDINLVTIALRRQLLEAIQCNKKVSYRFDSVDVDDQPQGVKLIIEITPNITLLEADKLMQKLTNQILEK